ncbi:ATP-grasp domain-containing protein [Haloactinopolyspora sp.]|uniref:ATP-grasp domain-containing protein n=1 Tax=Haloactinopolyspora sp. TaxID=1966353 RepID=UPI0026182A6D|nr:ATP-grasp domain-containing protein [Haloactinopolyspora sp.]
MATLLMVESWLHSTGLRLPPLIHALGHRYVLLTRDPALYPGAADGSAHPVVRDADDIVIVDTNDHGAVVAAAKSLAARRGIDGVVTTCDYYLEAVAHAADALRLPGPAPDVVKRMLRKHEVRTATARAGLATPAHAAADTWPVARAAAERIGYPVVAKPVDLNSGTSVCRADDEAALKDAYGEITAAEHNTRGQRLARLVLVEELLDGPEVSVEAMTYDGVTTVLGITGKDVAGAPAFVEAGHVFPAMIAPDQAREVQAHVRAALTAVGHRHGLSHTEVRLTEAGPRIVEINPRQGGGYIFDLVRLVTGVDPLELLVALALGDPASAQRHPAQAPASAVAFVMSPEPGRVTAVEGVEQLAGDDTVVRCEITTPQRVAHPCDNNSRLGHILVTGPDAASAHARARAAIGLFRLGMDDGRIVAPLGAEA